MGFIRSLRRISDIVKSILHPVLRDNECAKRLLRIIDYIEKHQDYMWKYIDYGFRTPIFRNMQWIHYGPEIRIEKRRDKEYERIRRIIDLLLMVNIHLLKEYFQAWFTLLDAFKNKRETLKSSLQQLSKRTGVKYDDGPIGELGGGISAELKASFVLVDNWKPFLPLSIMQSPVVPSIFRLTASGDLYLFEENLVVDVKNGWLIKTKNFGKLPTYYYRDGGHDDRHISSLSKDLAKCSDLHKLYGIRKGIGVVAEDREETIHFAVYVPWRRWRISGPLLYLKSTKLPFLIYLHRRNFELYTGKLRKDTLSVKLNALLLSKKDSWIDCSKWSLEVYKVKDERLVRQPIGGDEVSFRPGRDGVYSINVKVPITAENHIEYREERFAAFNLVYENGVFRVPVFVAIESG